MAKYITQQSNLSMNKKDNIAESVESLEINKNQGPEASSENINSSK